MDVAWAVGKYLARLDADDELSLGVVGHQRIVRVDARDAVEPHPIRVREADEEQPDVRVLPQISHRDVHAVPVVVGERDRLLVHDAHESGLAALVRAVRAALFVRRRDEEHVDVLDERRVVLADEVVEQDLFDAVRDPPRVEPVLQLAAAVVIDDAHVPASLKP